MFFCFIKLISVDQHIMNPTRNITRTCRRKRKILNFFIWLFIEINSDGNVYGVLRLMNVVNIATKNNNNLNYVMCFFEQKKIA